MSSKIAVFQDRSIRRMMVDGVWYFSVIDVVGALTDSVNPRDYWFKMKQRVHSGDGIELSAICRQLKQESSDGGWSPTGLPTVALAKAGQTINSNQQL